MRQGENFDLSNEVEECMHTEWDPCCCQTVAVLCILVPRERDVSYVAVRIYIFGSVIVDCTSVDIDIEGLMINRIIYLFYYSPSPCFFLHRSIW